MKNIIVFTSSILLTLLLMLTTVEAAQVQAFKGRKVLVDLQSTSARPGDRFYALSGTGQKIGLIEIKRVKGTRGLALLLKGKIERGAGLQAIGGPAGQGSSSQTAGAAGGGGSRPSSNLAFGGSVGLSMNSLDLTNAPFTNNSSDNVTASLTGTSFTVSGLADYTLTSNISFRALAGIDTVQMESPDKHPESNEALTVDFTYFALSGLARFNVLPGAYNPWIGAGYTQMIPMGVEGTTIDKDKVSLVGLIPIVFGADIELDSKSYIPIQFEYNLWLNNDDVFNLTTMVIRAGYMMRF